MQDMKDIVELLQFVKNDTQYFKRIEDLRQQEMQLNHVKDIANTLQQAELYISDAKIKAAEVIAKAEQEAKEIKAEANKYKVDVDKAGLDVKELKKQIKEKEKEVQAQLVLLKEQEVALAGEIKRAQANTQAGLVEYERYKNLKHTLEDKFVQFKQIMNS